MLDREATKKLKKIASRFIKMSGRFIGHLMPFLVPIPLLQCLSGVKLIKH